MNLKSKPTLLVSALFDYNYSYKEFFLLRFVIEGKFYFEGGFATAGIKNEGMEEVMKIRVHPYLRSPLRIDNQVLREIKKIRGDFGWKHSQKFWSKDIYPGSFGDLGKILESQRSFLLMYSCLRSHPFIEKIRLDYVDFLEKSMSIEGSELYLSKVSHAIARINLSRLLPAHRISYG